MCLKQSNFKCDFKCEVVVPNFENLCIGELDVYAVSE